MPITHPTVKAPGEKVFAAADWNANHAITSPITVGTLVLGSGSITDTSGAISFGDENLITTGNINLPIDTAYINFGAHGIAAQIQFKGDGRFATEVRFTNINFANLFGFSVGVAETQFQTAGRLTFSSTISAAVDAIEFNAGAGGIVLKATTAGKQIEFDTPIVQIDEILKVGGDGVVNYTQIAANGDVTFVGSAGFYPRRLNQANIPASGVGATQIDVGELLMWRDTDDGKVYLVYNDTTSGIKSVELI